MLRWSRIERGLNQPMEEARNTHCEVRCGFNDKVSGK
jgi:hypothetical protein